MAHKSAHKVARKIARKIAHKIARKNAHKNAHKKCQQSANESNTDSPYFGNLGQCNANRNGPICVVLPKVTKASIDKSGNPYWRGSISTVVLLVLSSLEQLFLMLKLYFYFLTKQPILMRR